MPILLEEPTTTETPRRKRRTKLRLFIGLAVFALFVAIGLYLTSGSFRDRIRLKVVHELEIMTGGRVELSSLSWNLSRVGEKGWNAPEEIRPALIETAPDH